jgi:hypothetical protein
MFNNFSQEITMKAIIFLVDGERVEAKVTKTKSGWLIGGDVLRAWADLGATVYIETEKGVYILKGGAMHFVDYKGCL